MMKVELIDLGYSSLSNCYLLTDEATGVSAIVDPGYYTDELAQFLSERNPDIKYILLTHGHFDHIMGASPLREVTGAEMLIHKDDAICLDSEEMSLMIRFEVQAPLIHSKPDRELEDGDEILLGETVLRVMSTPGHSRGSVIFIDEKDRIIISGDTLFRSTVGRTDAIGGSETELKESMEKIISLEGDYDIYPGHGPFTTLSNERVRNIFVRRMGR